MRDFYPAAIELCAFARIGARARTVSIGSLVAALALAVLLGACGEKTAGSGGKGPGGATGAGPGAMPPPEVGVITVQPGEVGLVTELPGRLEASRVAQVSARVAGIVQKRVFTEGSDVKAGQVLFRIDSAPYQATLNSAQAQLASAQANLAQAAGLAKRYKPLVAANAISKQEYANAVAGEKTAAANVGVARAAVKNAQINLGYGTVTAPISGRIGRALVTEGALVGQGQPTPLAVVQQIDPVYVNFTQSAAELLRLRRAFADGKLQKASGDNAAQVRVVFEDGSEYPQPGKLLFSDLTVDPSTGQITLRAEVPNQRGVLLPGMYVRVRIEQAQIDNAITVPQQAVTRTQQGDQVTVVSPEGKLSKREVKIGAARDNQWVVLDGLKAGEQVMVDGFQKLQMMPPGASVKPVPWTRGGASSGAGGPAAGGDRAGAATPGGSATDKPDDAAGKPAAARH